MAWLLVSKEGKSEYLSVVFDELSSYDKERIKRGWVKSIEISTEDAKLSFDVLSRLFKDKINPDTKPSRQIDLNVIVGIIKTSDQEGEREAAKLVYKKITGKAFVG